LRTARTWRQPLRAGERTSGTGKAVSNAILLSLPDAEYLRIRPHLQFVNLPHHENLHEPGRKLKFAYFLNTGMISIILVGRDGKSVEIGVTGKEGFTPIPLAVGLKRSPHRAIVQVAGEGFRLSVAVLEKLLPSSPRFQATLNRYAVVHGLQVGQTAGCNRLHNLEQRLSRWLLLTQDRVDSGSLEITHDFLATMLGTDRPSVSLAANSLQKKGIIEYMYGGVKILNRKKLERSACECYDVIHQFDGEFALQLDQRNGFGAMRSAQSG
jgi:CRP-like cAMP-binding protein